MTKLRVMSDLHLEFGPLALEPIGEDVLILAGDVDLGARGADWATAYHARSGVPVVMIAGNHEFYRQPSIEAVLAELRRPRDGVSFLEDDFTITGDVTFVGATLWTDYALTGNVLMAMLTAKREMNDYRLIRTSKGRRFFPEDAAERHAFSIKMLATRLASIHPPLVVVTHHLPSARSIHPDYAGDPLNPAYASHLDDLIESSGAALWIHGHTHRSADYKIGLTRVICNPRGYYPHDLNNDFDPNLIIEV